MQNQAFSPSPVGRGFRRHSVGSPQGDRRIKREHMKLAMVAKKSAFEKLVEKFFAFWTRVIELTLFFAGLRFLNHIATKNLVKIILFLNLLMVFGLVWIGRAQNQEAEFIVTSITNYEFELKKVQKNVLDLSVAVRDLGASLSKQSEDVSRSKLLFGLMDVINSKEN